jgi:hypothetical protein
VPSNASNMRSSSMSERQTIDAALRNPRLLGAAISDVATWRTWRVVLKAAFGLGLSTPEERAMTAWSAKVSISLDSEGQQARTVRLWPQLPDRSRTPCRHRRR